MKIGYGQRAFGVRQIKQLLEILDRGVTVLAIEPDQRVYEHSHANAGDGKRNIEHDGQFKEHADRSNGNPHGEENEKDFLVVLAAYINRPLEIPPRRRLVLRVRPRVSVVDAHMSYHSLP